MPNLAFDQSRQNPSIYNAVPRTPKTYSLSTFITPSFLSLTTLSISRVLSLILQWPFSVPFVQVDQNEHVENVSSMRWECVSEVGMCRWDLPTDIRWSNLCQARPTFFQKSFFCEKVHISELQTVADPTPKCANFPMRTRASAKSPERLCTYRAMRRGTTLIAN